MRFPELERYAHVSTGALPGCSECGFPADASDEDVSNTDPIAFSKRKCDLCRSPAHGQRHPAHAQDEDGDTAHLEVCEDCLLAIEAPDSAPIFDRFDICDAYHTYYDRWHVGGVSARCLAKGRSIPRQLERLRYNPGPLQTEASLSENARAIYLDLIATCEGTRHAHAARHELEADA